MANVKIDPDTVISVNGTAEIPKGLFGFHAVNVPKSNDPPEENKPAPLDYIKQLNPGFLRPLDHVGWGGKPLNDEQIKTMQAERVNSKAKPAGMFFQLAEAGNCIDNIVWCHTVTLWSRPSWMDSDMSAFLASIKAFYREKAASAWVPGDDFNLLRRFEVWNEPFMWGRHINMGRFLPEGRKDWTDPTQFGYIPAKVGTDVYSTIFETAVAGAKSANPHVQLGGPSAPAFNTDFYSNFEDHVRLFIDRCHDKIDFLTEHHYQGEPDSYAASYIVAAAYGDVKYNKRIPVYNTECNDLVDTPTKGNDGEAPSWSLKADQLNKAHYNIQDILACARYCPDVARGRAMHALWTGYCKSQGETAAYTILNTLRGKMLSVQSSDPAIWAFATSPADGQVVLFFFNNSPTGRRAVVAIPEGFRQESRTVMGFGNDGVVLTHPQAKGAAAPPLPKTLGIEMAPRSAEARVLLKDGYKPTAVRTIETSYADTVLARVKPDKPAKGKIIWRGAGPAGAKAASLRVVTTDVHRGEAVAVINGREIDLLWSSSNDACAIVQDIPIDTALLNAQTTIEFHCKDPANANGFIVWAAGINLER